MNLTDKPDRRHFSKSQHGHRVTRGRCSEEEWRCHGCSKLLGIRTGGQMHIRRKPADYLVGYPITAKCPGCSEINVQTNG